MGLRTRLIAAARAAYNEFRRLPASNVAVAPPTPQPKRAPEVTHKDVGKHDPIAFCTGAEYGVACTDEWLDVDCPACHEKRHEQAPLSDREIMSGLRATGPKSTRRLTPGEIVYDGTRRDLQWGRRR